MRLLAAALAMTLGGCFEVGHHCSDSTQCERAGVGGVCEPVGYCSFPDPVCGRRYGEGAGAMSGACVTGLDGGDQVDAAPVDAGIDAPSTDRDGDGVSNPDDNCPDAANADQHDEDTDGVGDVCDLCPAMADPLQANSDGDGLGDVCDPRPGNPRNQLVLFEPFTGTGLGPWTATDGTWTRSGDAMRVNGSSAIARLSRTLPMPAVEGVIIEARASVTGIAAPAAVTYLGVAAPADFAVAGHGCAVYDNLGTTANAELMSTEIQATTLLFNRIVTLQQVVAPGDVVLTESHTTGTRRCDLTYGTERRGGGFNDTLEPPIATIGLFARNLDATYTSLFVYTD